MPKKLKPTPTNPFAFPGTEGAAKLDRLKTGACAVVNNAEGALTQPGDVDELRAALLDGHAVEEVAERYYAAECGVYERTTNGDATTVGYADCPKYAGLFAAALNDLTHQGPVSPFGENKNGWLTFEGEVVRDSDEYRISSAAADALNALWDGNGEHDE